MSQSKYTTISISTGTIFKVLIIGLVLLFLWHIKEIVVILLLALMLSALIEPSVSWLHHKKIPRSLGVIGIYIILLAVLAISFILIIPPFVEQFQQLLNNFSSISVKISETINRVVIFGQQHGIEQDITQTFDELRDSVGSLLGNVFSTITGIVGGVFTFFIILVLSFYIVVEEDAWRRLFRRLAPDEYQPYLTQLFSRMQTKIGLWMRGELMLMLAIFVTTYIGLTILGIPYALVLALFAGILEIVPYAGPTLSAIPAIMIALAESPFKAVMTVLLFVIIQQIENHILIPKVMQKVTGLNPIVSITALLIGFKLAGIAGAALAIPVATMASVVVYDVFKMEEDRL